MIWTSCLKKKLIQLGTIHSSPNNSPLGLEPVELPPHVPHGTLLGPEKSRASITWGRNIETSWTAQAWK